MGLFIRFSIFRREGEAVITVVTPTYNRPRMLLRAVKSFLLQVTTEAKRMIIIDNGTTEDMDDVLHYIREHDLMKEVSYIRYEVNVNPNIRLNEGFDGRSVMTMLFDDDEFFDEHSLQMRCAPIIHCQCDATYSDWQDYGDKSGMHVTGEQTLENIRKRDCVGFGTMAWNALTWSLCGPLHPDLWFQADWLFKIRVFEKIRIEYIPVPTMRYWWHPSQENRRMTKADRERENAIVFDTLKAKGIE